MMISVLFIFSFCFLPNLIHSDVPFVLNPDCDIAACKDFRRGALYYANQVIGEKKIHMMYSSFHDLTIMIMETDKTASPIFNYAALAEKNYTGAFRFDGTKPVNSLTLVIRRLIEFNDPDDTGLMHENQDSLNAYLLSDYPTDHLTSANNNTDHPSFAYLFDELNATLKIDVTYPGEIKRDDKFPKLRTESSSYFLNIALTASNSSFPKARFAFELYIISQAVEYPTLSSSKYIDDQYTPGIFSVWQMKSAVKSLYPSSMLWKPVVYQSEERTIEQNTLMQIYSMKNNIILDPDIDQGIYYSIFTKPNVSAFNVSLGATTDGFFKKTNYGFIQFTAGLDILQPDATAKFVTVALIISLALPAVVAIIAIIFIIRRRLSNQSSDSNYRNIND